MAFSDPNLGPLAGGLAATLYGHLKNKQALDLADYRQPNGVRLSSFDRDAPITLTDAELRREAAARVQALDDYRASDEGRAEAARVAAVREQDAAVQRAFGWPA